MRNTRDRNWLIAFVAIGLFGIAQLGWWTWLLMQSADTIATLKRSQAQASLQEIEEERLYRRRMYLWEASAFVALGCFGFWALYHFLRREAEVQRVQRQFLETFTHGIRTPLTALQLQFANWRERLAPEPFQSELREAQEEISRIIRLVDKVLQLRRIDEEVLLLEELDLRPLIQKTIDRLKPFLENHQAEVTLTLPEELAIRGDRSVLQNAILSLLENAVQHNPMQEKQVWIRGFPQGNTVVVEIEDNGPGLRGYVLPSGNPKGPDTSPRKGLGLWIAEQAVRCHRGQLSLHPGPGGGLQARFQIPSAVEGTL